MRGREEIRLLATGVAASLRLFEEAVAEDLGGEGIWGLDEENATGAIEG